MKNRSFKFFSLVLCLFLCSCKTSFDAANNIQTSKKDKPSVANTTIVTFSETTDKTSVTNEPPVSGEIDNHSTINNAIEESVVNEDLISELGMTYAGLCKKYDDHPEALYNTCHFKGGYGVYGWKSFEGIVFDDIDEAGGCNIIDGLNTYKLLRTNEPLTFDELVNNYGFVLVSDSGEEGMDFRFWSEFSHPAYNDIYFSFATTEKEVIDSSTSISIGINKDCLEAGK